MAEKVTLKIFRCPTCGANLKAQNSNDAITCVYCGNTVVPVSEASAAAQNENNAGFGGTVKVEGLKTPASALAYIELFFEEYDWEAFTYAQALSVAEIDKLTDALKASCADDKNTWFACFNGIFIPFSHKLAGYNRILSTVVEEYKKDNLDAYSKFDAYKRIAAMIKAHSSGIVAQLEKIAAKAAKYGASAAEFSALHSDIDSIKNLKAIEVYADVEELPEIKSFIREKNARIVAELAAKGIDAEAEYARAKSLMAGKKYVEALNLLRSLKGFSDADALIEKLDKYFLISDVLEIEDNLYYFREDGVSTKSLSLYPTQEGKVAAEPIIENIRQIITNYADILYYLDKKGKLRQYKLSDKTGTKICDKSMNPDKVYVYGRRVFLITGGVSEYSAKREIIELDLPTGTVKTLLSKVTTMESFTGGKLVYTVSEGIDEVDEAVRQQTNIINVDTGKTVSLGTSQIRIEGYVSGNVVYTRKAPNDYNQSLYIKSLSADKPETLIEQNIYQFCDIIAGKLFYYIGNSSNKSLIHISCDGTGRREWPQFISKILFEQGGWLYFVRRAGYNSILCKSRLDGSKYSIIAADIDTFIEIKNGYLYYINDEATLVKVRMDGSNLQELCDDVESVLAVKEDKIIFVSVDDRVRINAEVPTVRTVKSIYAVDFSGSGKIKLAYNIETAKKYDENTVYYLASQGGKNADGQWTSGRSVLHRLDVETNQTKELLKVRNNMEKSGCYVATAVYGSYDCPQVWTLRRFRDDTLAATWYGRAFIRTYYAVSPTLVRWFGDTRWFKGLWKGKLDRMVAKLQENGVASTPYEDQSW